jgi:tetratricopeptide (TPR) repeat protein
LYVAQRRWAEAEQSFAKAVALSPQYSTARQWYGTMFGRLRRCDEALEQVRIAVRLDPLTALVNEALGSVYLGCGEPGRALEVFDTVLAMHPTAHTTRHRRSVALIRLARYDEAIRELEALAIALPSEAVTGALAIAHAKAGREGTARTLLAEVTTPFQRARIFAALGDAAGIWPMLEDSLAGRGVALQNLVSEPEFEPYRDDPRFVDFARRAGFPLPIRDARFSAGPARSAR